MSLILPVINQLFFPDAVSLGEAGSFFSKAFLLFEDFTKEYSNKELIAIVLLFSFMTLSSLFLFLIIYVSSGLTAKLTYDCRELVFKSIYKLPFSEFSKNARGLYIQLLITETRSVYAIFKLLFFMIMTFINLIIISILLFLLSWKLSLILLLSISITICANIMLTRKIKITAKQALNQRSTLAERVTESIMGLKQVKMLGYENNTFDQVNHSSRQSEKTARSVRIFTAALELTSQILLSFGVIWVIVVWSYLPVFSSGIPKIAGLLTFLIIISRLIPYVGSLAQQYGGISSNLPSVNRLNEYLLDKENEKHFGVLKPDPLFKEEIVFSNISFEYNENQEVFNNLSLTVPKGSYIGIKGTSGVGKSTLFSLLTRFIEPQSGSILLDDENINNINLPYLRSKIGYLPQDFYIFNTTIKNNLLTSKPDATDEECWLALERAGLNDYVKSLPNGLNSGVGNNGENLSGGERQRLSLAILFLLDPEIIILDEVTSSVDIKTEKHILNSIKKFHQNGKTIISSAHRESALIDADSLVDFGDKEV